jgi:tetratricopeptide (TPR) repeat protein
MKTGMPRPTRAVLTGWLGLLLSLFACLTSFTAAADSKCKLGEIARFPIVINNMRALMSAGINGADVQFIMDSGAFYSTLTAAGAAELKLQTRYAPMGLYIKGAGGGTADVSIATVKTFTLAGVPVKNVDFLVGGSEMDSQVSGLLGQNVLHIGDDDYDLPHGFVHLMKPVDCGKMPLAYWTIASSQSFSTIPIDQGDRPNWHTIGSAFVNGVEIRVLFDTGAPTSILSTRAAARAGITPTSPGVVPAGRAGGIGKITYAVYIAPFTSFKIGDEEIKNARLRIGDIDLAHADMMLGLDFFLSHRIYVANSQGKMYFSYEGGPVFDLRNHRAAAAGDSSAGSAPSPETPAGDGAPSPDAKDQAADASREGAAAAARGQLEAAIAAFNRACELAPDNSDYLYQRGKALWRNKQPDLAKADFDRAVDIAPGDVPLRIARAELSLSKDDRAGALADLDAADAAAPKEANIRLTMGQLYGRVDHSDQALKQYDDWIDVHPEDLRLPIALNERCWLRALEGVQLPLALKDCNAAFRRLDKSDPARAMVLDSRGLVLLRMGEYAKSIADYDVSLKINPKRAWGYYGRGVDELRLNKAAEGQADIDRAKALAPKLADEAARRGIVP